MTPSLAPTSNSEALLGSRDQVLVISKLEGGASLR